MRWVVCDTQSHGLQARSLFLNASIWKNFEFTEFSMPPFYKFPSPTENTCRLQSHHQGDIQNVHEEKKTVLKISFTGPSDKMSGDVEFGSDICCDDLQFSFDSEISLNIVSLNDTNEYQQNVLILNGKCCEDIKFVSFILISKPKLTCFPEQQY